METPIHFKTRTPKWPGNFPGKPDNVARMQGAWLRLTAASSGSLETLFAVFHAHLLFQLSSFLWADLVITTGGWLGFLTIANVLAWCGGGGGEAGNELTKKEFWDVRLGLWYAVTVRLPAGMPSHLKEWEWSSRIKISRTEVERKMYS